MSRWFCLALLVVAPLIWAADINGKWSAEFDTEAGIRELPLVVAVAGEKATVTVNKTDLTGSYKGGNLEVAGTYYSEEGGYDGEMKLSLKFDGGKLTGEGSWEAYEFTISATRAE